MAKTVDLESTLCGMYNLVRGMPNELRQHGPEHLPEAVRKLEEGGAAKLADKLREAHESYLAVSSDESLKPYEVREKQREVWQGVLRDLNRAADALGNAMREVVYM